MITNQFVAWPGVGKDGDQIAHGARRHEHAGLFAQQIRYLRAQLQGGRVVVRLLVADHRLCHGSTHAGRRRVWVSL
jgi:hypothetical protein